MDEYIKAFENIGGVILTAPVSLPAIVTTIGGYVAVTGEPFLP
ncbi:hypothetical protein [Mesonia aestuariivivens]|nr:hypothetical protein [Mesonia aestuariivivens]